MAGWLWGLIGAAVGCTFGILLCALTLGGRVVGWEQSRRRARGELAALLACQRLPDSAVDAINDVLVLLEARRD